MNIEEIATRVAVHPDYRVLRRYVQPPAYNPDDSSLKYIGLSVDTETTGLNYKHDRIIELGIAPFAYSPQTDKIYRLFAQKQYAQFEDPGIPIPPGIVHITGITDDMVRGQHIDEATVNSLLQEASLIIAHNAEFDRKFLEKRFPKCAEKAWACLQYDVPWKEEGLACLKLECLASHFGFFFKAHRALQDSLAALHILSQQLPASGRPVLQALRENALRKTCRVWAAGSPIEKKDILREHGYRWDPGEEGGAKSWYKDIREGNEVAEEMHYLKTQIYCRDKDIPLSPPFDAYTRYSDRVPKLNT